MKNQYPIIFKASPLPVLLLLPDAPYFTIADVNTAYLKATSTKEADLVGKSISDAFPDNPEDVTPNAVSNLLQSLLTVISTGKPHKMATQKYDTPVSNTAKFTTMYWEGKFG